MENQTQQLEFPTVIKWQRNRTASDAPRKLTRDEGEDEFLPRKTTSVLPEPDTSAHVPLPCVLCVQHMGHGPPLSASSQNCQNNMLSYVIQYVPH